MVYGRLDVFGPDGNIRTFPLSSPNVSVGRSSGNTVMLDNSSISRYHFSITYENGEVYVADMGSANGTFVDGVKLEEEGQRLLGGGEEILIGNLRIIYHHIDETPTRPMAPTDDITQRVEAANAEFAVDLRDPGQSVSPGAHISAELSIANRTDQERRFTVEVTGLPKEWIRIDRPTPLIDSQDTAFILVNFKPLRRSDSQPGDYEVKIRVYPQDNPEAAIQTRLTLSILPYGGFGMALQSKVVSATEQFSLYLHNQGSAVLPLTIQGRDLAEQLNFYIPGPNVVLQPGQQITVQGTIKPRRNYYFGQTRRYPFDIVVQSRDAARFIAAIRGYVVQTPVMPRWLPLALMGAVGGVILLLVAALVLLALRPNPQPNFASFSLSSTLVARGEPLQIYWQATDVVDYELAINGTPVRSESDPQATAFLDVDTSAYTGQIAIQLSGYNGDLQASREESVRIYEPITGIQTFSITPSQLVRYVVDSLSIQWNVPGAVRTQILGLENFTSTVLEVNGPSGDFEGVAGIARDPITVRLVAQDEVGNNYEQSMTINVVNPECTPAGEGVTLHAGPDIRHQVIGTVPQGDPVVVNAQDVTGEWLRVLLPGEQTGWGLRTDFVCAGNFDPVNLYKEVDVPPLPPSPTPTLTPTVTLTPTLAPAPSATPSPSSTPLG